MASHLRPRLPPIHTAHSRNVSTNTVESDSSDSSPCPRDEDNDFTMHFNDSSSTIGALTAMQDNEMDVDMEHIHRVSPIQKLPPELLIHIFSKLTTTGELRNCALVCYHWALYTVGILWHRPLCQKLPNLLSVCKTLSESHPSFPYHEMVKRLNLSAIADKVNDGTVQAFFKCKSVERLTLTSCTKLTDQAVEGLVDGSRRLQALDVTDLESLTDRSMSRVAANCPKLQGLNITNCWHITDTSLSQIAFKCIQLKRLKLNGVHQATDQSITAVAQNCRSILEIDLAGCNNITSASITALLSNLPHLRELRLAHCTGIDNHAFTDLKPGLKFDTLRILDLTGCDGVGDDAINRIIPAAPRLRNLVLAKCRHITDAALRAICTLTKNLHYIHLGHCQLLTDAAVIELVQHCNRIRYIDLACCSRLTDASVRHLAKLPKLRRVGLVKCQNLTDASIIALARGPYSSSSSKAGLPTQFVSLERVHLSYCTSLTLKGITQLLLNCPRLTHLSLTGVQAFLRDDLTRFCREAPTEFTHVQRDVFCVFSGDGVIRLREYLARIAIEQAERDQEQQSAIDEPVLGPNSPEADSLSDGTVDGNDQSHVDMSTSTHPRGTVAANGSTARTQRPRPQSFHDMPRPHFHIEMPFLPSDQIQRIGPWTPGHVTPDYRQQGPSNTTASHMPFFGQYSDSLNTRIPSPLPTSTLPVPSQRSRSRSQSRRHTMDATEIMTTYGSQTQAESSRAPRLEQQEFGSDHSALPVFQTTMHGSATSVSTTRRAHWRNSSALRPDHTVSTFDLNHESILSTVPMSRGPSRLPSPSPSPRVSRVSSRNRFTNLFADVNRQSQSSQRTHSSSRADADTHNHESSRQHDERSDAIMRALAANDEADHLQRRIYTGPLGTSGSRALPPLLPSGPVERILLSSELRENMNRRSELRNGRRRSRTPTDDPDEMQH